MGVTAGSGDTKLLAELAGEKPIRFAVPAFDGLDVLVLAPVYAASERPLPGGTSWDLYRRFRERDAAAAGAAAFARCRRGGSASGVTTPWVDSRTARSTTFSSSRTLPGHP